MLTPSNAFCTKSPVLYCFEISSIRNTKGLFPFTRPSDTHGNHTVWGLLQSLLAWPKISAAEGKAVGTSYDK
jgi:hypothetical protein